MSLPRSMLLMGLVAWAVPAAAQDFPPMVLSDDDLSMDDAPAEPPGESAEARPGEPPPQGSGQEAGPAPVIEEFSLEEDLVVTATRFEQKVAEAPAIVQIFRAEHFRDWGIDTVADALRLLAGVYVRPVRTSQWTAIFRGTLTSDNNKFLLLVDGVPWRDAVYGWAWIDRYLTLANVRQIEVVRGPGSAMYGSNAFAGVINVITRRGDDVDGLHAGVSVGSFQRREWWVRAGEVEDVPLGRLDVAAYARYFEEAGDGPPFGSRGDRRIGFKDPHVGGSGGVRLSLRGLTLKWDVVDYRHARLDNGVTTFRDVVAQNPDLFNYRYLNNFVDARYDLDLPMRFHLQVRGLFQDYQNSGSYVKCVPRERIEAILPNVDAFTGQCVADYKGRPQLETVVEPVKDTRRLGVGLELQQYQGEFNRVVFGFEWEAEQIREVLDAAYVSGTYVPGLEDYEIPHTPLSIHDLALYIQDTLRPIPGSGLGITAGARVGHHRIPRWRESTKDFDVETFNHFSPRLGLVYGYHDLWVFKLLYGRAYRAPTARELLLESHEEWVNGDPTLEPEVVETTEAEITLRPKPWISWTTSGYYNNVADEIIERESSYDRSKGFRVMGLDTELRLQLRGMEAMVNYSYTDAYDFEEDLPQYGVPRHMANWLLGYEVTKGLRLTVVGHHVGARPRKDWHVEGRPDGEPYTILDSNLRVYDLLGGRLSITMSIHNLLGAKVQYILAKERRAKAYHTTDYAMEDRAFMVYLEGKLF